MNLFYSTDYNSHLRTHRGGMVIYDREEGFTRSIYNLGSSHLCAESEPGLPKSEGKTGVGIISGTDVQPIVTNFHLGKLAIVMVAKINNLGELEGELLEANMHFSELSFGKMNQTELVALLITQGEDSVEGTENVYNKIKGSCFMLLPTEGGIIAARDRWGHTSIVIGRRGGTYAATSESSSPPNLDYETERSIGPGEIARLRADGMEQICKSNEGIRVCSFFQVYYGPPVSCYEDKDVEDVRLMSGCKVGQKDDSGVDCICGMPNSGMGMALGYAEGRGVSYHRAIAKYIPTWSRSLTPANQEVRALVAKMKLIPNRAMLGGRRILFCDDSIIRGTQLRDNAKILYDYGAREAHMHIARPPLIYSYPFIGFTSSKSPLELITRQIIKELERDESKNLDKYTMTDSPKHKKMVGTIAEYFGLGSPKFNALETLVEVTDLPKCKACIHYFDGSSCSQKSFTHFYACNVLMAKGSGL